MAPSRGAKEPIFVEKLVFQSVQLPGLVLTRFKVRMTDSIHVLCIVGLLRFYELKGMHLCR